MSQSRHRQSNHSKSRRAAFPRTPEAHQRANVGSDQPEASNLFSDLLREAVTRPGIISEAYHAFQTFSLGNQILAASQLIERGMAISPIASFSAWQSKGRMVRKGQKAIRLYMPVTIKRQSRDEETGIDQEIQFQTFALKPNWFSLDQTDGDLFVHEVLSPDWDAERAMTALDIAEAPFEMLNGNCQGYATRNTIAINPVAALPHKTRFHEMAHVVLGHTYETSLSDDERTPKNLREVEAESVAFILCNLLSLPGQDEARGYVQSWLGETDIPPKNARRIFSAADKLLKAGQRTLKEAVIG